MTFHLFSFSFLIFLFFFFFPAFNPDVVVFSGLHLLDGQEPEFQAQRISNLLDQLDQLPKHIPVHLELASMADKNLVTQLFSQVNWLF